MHGDFKLDGYLLDCLFVGAAHKRQEQFFCVTLLCDVFYKSMRQALLVSPTS